MAGGKHEEVSGAAAGGRQCQQLSQPMQAPLHTYHSPTTNPTHQTQPRRLKAIQDLVPSDVESALSKLPRDISADCVALLRRIFSIPPAGRPALADIMGDPWFRQFLPDLSKLAVAQPREQQSVAEITSILQVGGWEGPGVPWLQEWRGRDPLTGNAAVGACKCCGCIAADRGTSRRPAPTGPPTHPPLAGCGPVEPAAAADAGRV